MSAPTIFNIQTSEGTRVVWGEKVGDNLVVGQNGDLWTITHLNSGHTIAHFSLKDEALAVATILDVTCKWEWVEEESELPSLACDYCQSTAVVLEQNLKGEAERIIKQHGFRVGIADDETITSRP